MNPVAYTDNPLIRQHGPHKVFSWLRSGAIKGKTPEDFGFPEDFGYNEETHMRVLEIPVHTIDLKPHVVDIFNDAFMDDPPPPETEEAAVPYDDAAKGLRRLTLSHKGTETQTLFTYTALATVGDGFLIYLLPMDNAPEDPAKPFGKIRSIRSNAMAAAQRKSKRLKETFVVVINSNSVAGVYFQGKLLDPSTITF